MANVQYKSTFLLLIKLLLCAESKYLYMQIGRNRSSLISKDEAYI